MNEKMNDNPKKNTSVPVELLTEITQISLHNSNHLTKIQYSGIPLRYMKQDCHSTWKTGRTGKSQNLKIDQKIGEIHKID